jgi:hypothetical protein
MSSLESLGANLHDQTFLLYVRDGPTNVGVIKQEEPEGNTIEKKDNTNVKPSDQIICTAAAHPAVTLARRTTPGARIEGSIPPIHTYWVRDADKQDFERRDATRRSPFKENVPIAKRRKL